MTTDSVKNCGNKIDLTDFMGAFLSLISAVIIAVFLQLSIVFFSHIKKQGEIQPELMVSLLTFPHKKEDFSDNKPLPVKPVVPVKKKTPEKNIIRKSINKRASSDKDKKYSPVAKSAKDNKLIKQLEEKYENKKSDKVVDSLDVDPVPVPLFKLTEMPRFLHKEPLVYPEEMRSLGNAGVVKLAVLIDKYGVVRKVTVIASAGDDFDRQAKLALLASTFIAAKIKDKPVAATLKLAVKFNLI